MKIRRIAGCAAVVALIVGITLTADNVQSNFVPGDFGPAAEKLGIQQENGYYDLGRLLDALACRPPEGSAREPEVEWTGPERNIRAGETLTLTFRTDPDAWCRLYVIYETTGACARIGSGAGWQQADADGSVEWSWEMAADVAEQPATALVRVSADSADSWHSFGFSILARR